MANNNRNSSNSDATGDILGWVIIFILMFAFPPVGLLLLILKLRGYAKPGGNTQKRPPVQTNDAGRQAIYEAQTVAHQAGEAARKAVRDAEAAARNAGDAARQAMRNAEASARQATSQYTGFAKPAATGEYTGNTQVYIPNQKKDSKSKKKRKALEKKTGKFLSVLLLIVSIIMVAGGVTALSNAAQDIFGNGALNWYNLGMGIFYFFGGILAFFSRNIGVRRLARYKKYIAIVGERGVVPMTDIARATGQSIKNVNRDIQVMINEGYFDPGSYIDHELDCLVISAEEAGELRKSLMSEAEVSILSEDQSENQYMAIIKELREINVTIADVAISEKVDCIEDLTAKIFRIVEENPEKKPQIRRFMSYYLPTTLKLLRSYSTLEKQGVKGENIMGAKENIGRILDTLSKGFEQQLDQLFSSDAIDIAADINVLENLMQQDGLSGDKPEFRTMQSSG